MKNILVSGASGIVGYGILKSLKMSKEKYHLIGTSIYEDSIAEVFCDLFIKTIPTSDDNYIDWLISTIEKNKIDLIIPGIEIDMQVWNKNREMIQQTGVELLLNKSSLIELCTDKWKFYEYMQEHTISYSIKSSLNCNYEHLVKNLGKILLVKPRCGFGSQGIVKIENEKKFNLSQKDIGINLMVQEYVGSDDEEYSCSAFCDGEGSFISLMILKRKLSKDGFTEKALVVEDNSIYLAISDLCKHFKPLGPTNFQFRKCSNNELKLLEINPRISSSTSIRSAFGFNESIMSVEFFLDKRKLKKQITKKGRAIRYTEDFIFYE